MKLGRNVRLAGFESEYATERCEAQVVQRLHGPRLSRADRDPDEVRLRVAGRMDSLGAALRIGNELVSLYTCGPAGGGGVTKSSREIDAKGCTFIPRDIVETRVQFLETKSVKLREIAHCRAGDEGDLSQPQPKGSDDPLHRSPVGSAQLRTVPPSGQEGRAE